MKVLAIASMSPIFESALGQLRAIYAKLFDEEGERDFS